MAFEAQDLLLQAIEHFTSAVALFDSDDRLLLFNDSYVQMFGPGADSIVPGMTFVELVRRQVKYGLIPTAFGREEEWVAESMYRHHHPLEEFEEERRDGKGIWDREDPTGNGGMTRTINT